MQFTPRDISILENFTIINPSVQFKTGNIQKTVSVSRSVILKAKLDVEFDRDFAVYDLSRFLRTLSLVEDHRVSLHDTHLVISNQSATVKYYYCASEAIYSINNLKTQDDIALPSVDTKFVLSGGTYQKLIKAIGMLGVKQIAVVGEGGKLFVETHDSERRVRDNLRIEIGSATGKFSHVYSSDNLKLIPGDYSVEISNSGLSKFSGMPGTATENLMYWVAVEG